MSTALHPLKQAARPLDPRRPPALVDPRVARLTAYVLLALVASLQWDRYVEGAAAWRGLAWVVAGAMAGGLVLLAGRRGWALALAALAGLGLALGASGLDLTYLEPNHLDELGAGLERGAGALGSVRLPYVGKEEWVLTTVQLSGAGLCWAAALLACWPGGRGRFGALVLLLVLAASPVVSIGTEHAALLGFAIALLTIAFLWLERLARRPGRSLAVVVGLLALVAVPAGIAADGDDPWFDYRAFSERLAGGTPVSFRWDHEYGPIDWAREGVELFRVDGSPRYWRVLGLDEFDNGRWSAGSPPVAGAATSDLPDGQLRQDWTTSFTVAINLLETEQLVGAGTTLAIEDETQPVEPDGFPGQWTTTGGDELAKGDSYTAEAYVPQPSPDELARARVDGDPRRSVQRTLELGLAPGTVRRSPNSYAGLVQVHSANVTFPAFGQPGARAFGEFPELGRRTYSVGATMRDSLYRRSWALAQRLKREADSPYAFVVAVDDYLGGPEFTYTENPPPAGDGEAPLEDFLFDARAGYCQQYSGAMAMLLRMGGVPARVATGFTPGGQPSSGGWVVRDTDAHSWVEAWFDGIGWVTFDPTPPATPARSQIAAINAPAEGDGDGGSDAPQFSGSGGGIEPKTGSRDFGDGSRGSGAGPAVVPDDGAPWPWIAAALAGALVLAGAVFGAWRAGGRVRTAQGALAELERALRRAGRTSAPGTTLQGLEQRLGGAGGGYLASLRAARYGAGGATPTRRQRAAFRAQLAADLGRGGRLRALYALPPTLPRRPGPGSSADRATAS